MSLITGLPTYLTPYDREREMRLIVVGGSFSIHSSLMVLYLNPWLPICPRVTYVSVSFGENNKTSIHGFIIPIMHLWSSYSVTIKIGID